MIFGPALGAILVVTVGIPGILIFDVFSFLAAIITLLYIFIRLGIGNRIFNLPKKDKGAGTMEHMV